MAIIEGIVGLAVCVFFIMMLLGSIHWTMEKVQERSPEAREKRFRDWLQKPPKPPSKPVDWATFEREVERAIMYDRPLGPAQVHHLMNECSPEPKELKKR